MTSIASLARARLAWQPFALFLLLSIFLVACGWSVIQGAGHEAGDFAANSLLIQDAKSLTLLKGNYSRVGFNHPGPAILYVLAFGELVLHDWLPLTNSPVGGQLMAVALYSAFWLVLMFGMLRRMTGALVPAVLGLSLFALGAVYLEHMLILGMWFPHLYFFPFAAMLLAGSRLVHGHTDTLTPLALASGFLVNGHASFVAILVIILLSVLAANRVLAAPGARLLSRAFYAEHRRALLRFGAVFGVFLLPLLLETVVRFPGPVYEYFKFSRGNHSNTWAQAANYVALYWGPKPFALLVAAALGAALWSAARLMGEAFGNMMRALLAVFAGATFAVVFYAKVGIDLLDQRYIGLFYVAVPALAIGLAGVCLYKVAGGKRRDAVALCVALAAVLATGREIVRPPEYVTHFNQPGVVDLYESLRKLPYAGRRMVLDLDPKASDAGTLWWSTLGLQIYAERRGDAFFCINTGWHISNTRERRCSDEEIVHGTRYQATMATPGATSVAAGMGLTVSAITPPVLPVGTPITVAAQPAVFSQYVLGPGWSSVEGGLVWSMGREPKLVLPLRPHFAGHLVLDLTGFVPRAGQDQKLTVQAGAGAPLAVTLTAAQMQRQVRIPVNAGADGRVLVQLRIARPRSPREAKLSSDSRPLGVSLRSITVEES